MKEAVKCCMQVWMYIYGLKNVKVAIEASANYSYIVDALAKEGYEVLGGRFNERKFTSNIMDSSKGNKELRDLVRQRIFLVKLEENGYIA